MIFAGQKLLCIIMPVLIPECKQHWRNFCVVYEYCLAEAYLTFLCYSLSQRISSIGETSVVLMNDAGQKLLCHHYATLYSRE